MSKNSPFLQEDINANMDTIILVDTQTPGFTGIQSNFMNALGKFGSFMGQAAGPLGIAASIGSSIFAAASARKQQRKAQRKERKARKEMNRLKDIYANLDTSNPFLNMENTMEDLTVNQQQAQFERETFQQSQANILEGLKGAAGTSGIAALAQSLAKQGQLAARQSSISIGQQESANQMAERREASRIQGLEIQGEYNKRQAELNKTSTLLGMAQQETAAYAQQAGAAQTARMQAITQGVTGAVDMMAGFGQGDGSTPAQNAPEGYKWDPATGTYIPKTN